MPGNYKFILRDGRNKVWNKRRTLKNRGWTWSPDDYGFIKTGFRADQKKHEKTARKFGLRLVSKDEDFARSSDYRERFFEANPPKVGQKWQCVYCGRLLDKRHVTVDHVIPVYQAQTSDFVRGLMKVMGIDDVNDVRNLVPACARCNDRKGAKYSLMWTWRARLGSHPAFWAAVYGGGGLAAAGVLAWAMMAAF